MDDRAPAQPRVQARAPPGVDDESGELGGLFVAPRVSAWLGRTLDGAPLTPETLPREIYERTGVVLNGGAWVGEQDRVRAVFSIPDAKLDRAIEALRALGGSLGGER